MKTLWISLLLVAAPGEVLQAQHAARGTVGVSAHIEGSINVVFSTDSGLPASNYSGSNFAAFSVPVTDGTFLRRSTAADPGDSSFLIVTPFQIRVVKANVASPTYTLTAGLRERDAAHTWEIDGTNLSDGAIHTIVSAEPYGTGRPHALRVGGSGPEAAQPFLNAIFFQVIVN